MHRTPTLSTRALAAGLALAMCAAASCRRTKDGAPAYPITPSCELGVADAPAGTPVAVTYVWTVGASAEAIPAGYRAFVHFVAPDGAVLLTDDHRPEPPPETWQPGRTYRYTRAVLLPLRAFAGPHEVRVGLFAEAGGARLGLRGADRGLREYGVGTVRVQEPDERLRIVLGSGWYQAEAPPGDPFGERRWMGREAWASFRNRKRDVIVMVKGETNPVALPAGATLRVAIGGLGAILPVTSRDRHEWRILFPAAALGPGRWSELRLTMSDTFVPKALGGSADDRELGFNLHGLYAGPADQASAGLREGALPATALPASAPAQRASPAASGRP